PWSPDPEKLTMRTTRWAGLAAVALTILSLLHVQADDAAKKVGTDAKEWDRVVDKAIQYLQSSQGQDGGWSVDKSPGVTGVALTAMLATRKVTKNAPTVEKALKYIESLVNPKAAHIAGQNPRVQLQNYVTSVNVMALVAGDHDSYKSVVSDATKFLKKLQW